MGSELKAPGLLSLLLLVAVCLWDLPCLWGNGKASFSAPAVPNCRHSLSEACVASINPEVCPRAVCDKPLPAGFFSWKPVQSWTTSSFRGVEVLTTNLRNFVHTTLLESNQVNPTQELSTVSVRKSLFPTPILSKQEKRRDAKMGRYPHGLQTAAILHTENASTPLVSATYKLGNQSRAAASPSQNHHKTESDLPDPYTIRGALENLRHVQSTLVSHVQEACQSFEFAQLACESTKTAYSKVVSGHTLSSILAALPRMGHWNVSSQDGPAFRQDVVHTHAAAGQQPDSEKSDDKRNPAPESNASLAPSTNNLASTSAVSPSKAPRATAQPASGCDTPEQKSVPGLASHQKELQGSCMGLVIGLVVMIIWF